MEATHIFCTAGLFEIDISIYNVRTYIVKWFLQNFLHE